MLFQFEVDLHICKLNVCSLAFIFDSLGVDLRLILHRGIKFSPVLLLLLLSTIDFSIVIFNSKLWVAEYFEWAGGAARSRKTRFYFLKLNLTFSPRNKKRQGNQSANWCWWQSKAAAGFSFLNPFSLSRLFRLLCLLSVKQERRTWFWIAQNNTTTTEDGIKLKE